MLGKLRILLNDPLAVILSIVIFSISVLNSFVREQKTLRHFSMCSKDLIPVALINPQLSKIVNA